MVALIIRDVGVAGSNPVTPTIDFIRVFYLRLLTVPGPRGSRFQKRFQFKRTIRSQNFGCPCTSADIEDPSCDHVGLPVFPPARLAGMRRVTSADLVRARADFDVGSKFSNQLLVDDLPGICRRWPSLERQSTALCQNRFGTIASKAAQIDPFAAI